MKCKLFAALGRFFKKPQVKAWMITAAIVAGVVGFFTLLALKPEAAFWIFVGIVVAVFIVVLYISILKEFED